MSIDAIILAAFAVPSLLLGVWKQVWALMAWAFIAITMMVVAFMNMPQGHPDYWSWERDGFGALSLLLMAYAPAGLVLGAGLGLAARELFARIKAGQK
jgi:hypothetical protein